MYFIKWAIIIISIICFAMTAIGQSNGKIEIQGVEYSYYNEYEMPDDVILGRVFKIEPYIKNVGYYTIKEEDYDDVELFFMKERVYMSGDILIIENLTLTAREPMYFLYVDLTSSATGGSFDYIKELIPVYRYYNNKKDSYKDLYYSDPQKTECFIDYLEVDGPMNNKKAMFNLRGSRNSDNKTYISESLIFEGVVTKISDTAIPSGG